MQHLYIKNFFYSKPMGVLTPKTPLATPLALYLVYECNVLCTLNENQTKIKRINSCSKYILVNGEMYTQYV